MVGVRRPMRAPKQRAGPPPGGGARAIKPRVRRAADLLRRVYGAPATPAREPPLDALIRTVLSQHTSDANSGRAFAALRRRFPRWTNVESSALADVASAIRSAGLANTKALRIRSILAEIRSRYGRLTLSPLRRMDDADALRSLRSLPGVGPKTAACVLLFSLGRDVFPVDTHVHRVCRRLGFVPESSSAARAQDMLSAWIPRGRALEIHINLIRHGRRVCRARNPRCGECALAKVCPQRRRFSGRPGCPSGVRFSLAAPPPVCDDGSGVFKGWKWNASVFPSLGKWRKTPAGSRWRS